MKIGKWNFYVLCTKETIDHKKLTGLKEGTHHIHRDPKRRKPGNEVVKYIAQNASKGTSLG